MNLTISDTDQFASSDAWLATNVTAWCNRMSAALSAAACEQHRSQHLEGRCFACGGLDNQHGYFIPNIRPVFEWDDPPSNTIDNDQVEGLAALDEIIDGFYDDPAPGDDFSDVELDLDDEQLLALFPEFAEVADKLADTETNFPRFTEYQKAAKRRAVYNGRCKRCNGYMENTREAQDDNVFHCLACGWRTAPSYESNRALHAAKGAIQ